jgi:putative transposase
MKAECHIVNKAAPTLPGTPYEVRVDCKASRDLAGVVDLRGARVSRSGVHAWLVRAPSAQSRNDEEYAGKIRASFISSDRTYGVRRIWHNLLAKGLSCACIVSNG